MLVCVRVCAYVGVSRKLVTAIIQHPLYFLPHPLHFAE